jgi:hypothetical protein
LAALAFPEEKTIAWAEPDSDKCFSLIRTGDAFARFFVKTPAALQGDSEYNKDTSDLPEGFIPADTPEALNPIGKHAPVLLAIVMTPMDINR